MSATSERRRAHHAAVAPRRRAAAVAVVATLTLGWALALLLAPAAVGEGPAVRVAPAVPVAVYWAGSVLCHQQAGRSPWWFGRQAPVCGRCAGLYFGAPLGALAAATAWSRRVSAHARIVVLVAAVPTVLSLALGLVGRDGLVAGRALAAVPLGAAAAWAVTAVLAGDLT